MSYHSKLEKTKRTWQKLLRNRWFHYNRTFSTESGKITLENIVKDAKINETAFHKDPAVMHYRSGYRDCALRILRVMAFTPDKIKKLTNPEELEYDDD